MRGIRSFSRTLAVVAAVFFIPAATAFDVRDLTVPQGYSVALYTDAVPNARQMALSPSGIVFVGSLRLGTVYAVIDSDGDFTADEVVVVARDLNMPSGVAFRAGSLYVAEVDRILRFDNIEQQLHALARPVVVSDALPRERHHGWKFIAFGPDGRLYVAVGAPCNICEVEAPFGAILSMPGDGGDLVVHASGIRNSVGFDWHPSSGDLWFSDNGRDWLGDDRPPGELNRAPKAGLHFGFPYFHGGDMADPEFGTGHDAVDFTAPALRLGAHVAPLGIEFYRGAMFPAGQHHHLFVAEHGSWNRSRKSGYRVMRATVDDLGTVVAYEPFVSGWLQGQGHWGRPVDFAVMADGSLLISDDDGGRIYRVTYKD